MARKRIALDHFLSSFDNPAVALSARQKYPKTLNEASLLVCEVETTLSLTQPGANDTVTSLNSVAHKLKAIREDKPGKKSRRISTGQDIHRVFKS